MKALISFCVIAMAVTVTSFQACNKVNAKTSSSTLDSSGYSPTQKGMELTYQIVSGDEVGGSSIMEVKEIHDSAGYNIVTGVTNVVGTGIVSPFYIAFNKEKTIQSVYPVPAYYESLPMIKQQYDVFTHEERPYSLTFPSKNPINFLVYPQTIFCTWHGEKRYEYSSTVADYSQIELKAIIDSIGKISIPLGNFDCIRVHHIRKLHTHIVITDLTDGSQSVLEHSTDFDMKEWFSLGIGFVKGLETNLNTGETTVTELSKIEMP